MFSVLCRQSRVGQFCSLKSHLEVPIDEEDESEAPKSFNERNLRKTALKKLTFF